LQSAVILGTAGSYLVDHHQFAVNKFIAAKVTSIFNKSKA